MSLSCTDRDVQGDFLIFHWDDERVGIYSNDHNIQHQGKLRILFTDLSSQISLSLDFPTTLETKKIPFQYKFLDPKNLISSLSVVQSPIDKRILNISIGVGFLHFGVNIREYILVSLFFFFFHLFFKSLSR